MKSRASINRRKNKRKKRNGPSKAADLAAANMEQATLDSLDPIKNANNNSLFIFDATLPHKNAAGDNKKIKNKTTWADTKLAYRGLGVITPKYTGKTMKEKRKLNDNEKQIIESKAKRMKGEKGEVKKEEDEAMGDNGVFDVDEEDKKSVLLTAAKAKEDSTNKAYDLWAAPAPKAIPGHQAFIHDILNPKMKEFIRKPLENKLPAVEPIQGQSYRPEPKEQEALLAKKKAVTTQLGLQAQEATRTLKRLSRFKNYFPPIDKNIGKPTVEEMETMGDDLEDIEPIREEQKRHKTAKEVKKIHEKKIKRDAREREEEFNRKQREVYRIPQILEGIEEQEKGKVDRNTKRKENKAKRAFQPYSTDGRKIKQSPVVPVLDTAPGRLRNLTSNVNPLEDRIKSMKNRGIMSAVKAKRKHVKHMKLVEPMEVRDAMRADEDKYLKPILEKINAK